MEYGIHEIQCGLCMLNTAGFVHANDQNHICITMNVFGSCEFYVISTQIHRFGKGYCSRVGGKLFN